MATRNLVIVESPTKAKTIRKFLPNNYAVYASMGHVRDLPQTAADVPQKLKKEPWARLGVNVENDFEPLYVSVKGKSKIITEIRKELKQADVLYLATDEDREGESISWHLVQMLKPKIPIKRMVFHEITKKAINAAIENSREIDQRLVRAQETRRILDRLYGFTLSPLIWKKIAYGLSAGRVQSVGLRLLVERERERLQFVKATYWDLKAELEKSKKTFAAKLVAKDGKRVATGKDFDERTGKPKNPGEICVFNEKDAEGLVKSTEGKPWTVTSVEEKRFSSKPSPPFITSTMQQEGNRKLGLSVRDTMRTAQALYEQGLITYMRTDSPVLSSEAIEATRSAVSKIYGDDHLSPEPRQYSSKSKSAQEAHEAIRPAGETFKHPGETGLTGKELGLYSLIWSRTMATQMAEARKVSVSAKINVADLTFSASGTRIEFPGFLAAYQLNEEDAKEVILPELKEGEEVQMNSVEAVSHETKPIARFTEASLVQRLEKEGVGRPSTYASIIGTVIDRGYARKVGNALVPSLTGFAVFQILESHFGHLIDYGFTSDMEEALDQIADGKVEWIPYLKGFYLGNKGLQKVVELNDKKIDVNEARVVKLLDLNGIDIRVGRFGPYVVKKTESGEEVRASIPEDVAPADLTIEMVEEIIERSERGPESLGKHPDTGQDIYCLIGRYGPYVQQGEMVDGEDPPRRSSVPKEIDYRNITLEEALKLLSLPRELGKHPETKEPIMANRGRFGPYVVHQDDFRSLKKDDDVFTVTLERALEILAEEKKGRRGSKVLKELGQHPKGKKKIQLLEGRYGPYLKMGTKNFGIPKDTDTDKLDLKLAIQLIDGGPPEDKDAEGGEAEGKTAKAGKKKAAAAKKKAPAKKKAAKKKTAAKPAAKKKAAKKAAAKN